MNEERLAQWITELRTTEETQCKGQLHVDGDGYCCLGIGYKLVPGYSERDLLSKRLAPPSFLIWLGFERVSSLDEDVRIDWQDGLETQGQVSTYNDEDVYGGGVPYTADMGGAAELNDSDFTFKQIADVLAYFGIRERGTE